VYHCHDEPRPRVGKVTWAHRGAFVLLRTIVFGTMLAGCSRQGPSTTIAVAPVDTMWYVSTRARENGRDTRLLADSLEYGYVVSLVKTGRDPLTSGVEITPVDSFRLTRLQFEHSLRERARDPWLDDSLVVLYVHGFGTSLREAWEHTGQARIRSRSSAPWVVFCWPSRGASVAWPSATQIFARAYREDSAAAAASRDAFARTVRDLLPVVGGEHLLLVAHSLGAQLIGEALAADTALRNALVADPLRALAFFAPDVESGRFHDYVLPATSSLASRVVLYVSTDDRVLSLSRGINGSERAGLARGGAKAHPGVEVIDVTAGTAAENRMQRLLGSHHGLRRASAALFDLLHLVAGMYEPACRETLGTATLVEEGIWKLTHQPPPPVSAPEVCSR
jgi:hypothetical protein